MDKNILHEKIYYYENVITDFDNFNKALEKINNGWETWTACGEVAYLYGESKIINLDNNDENMSYIYNSIMDAFYNACKDYAESLGDYDEPRLFPSIQMKKYQAGTYMGAHYDQLDGDKTLRYSMVMYLNDDYEGGEISFKIVDSYGISQKPHINEDYDAASRDKHFDVGIKPKANSMVVFPSSSPYFHTAHIVKSGFKCMIPGHWIHNDMEYHVKEEM
jgi:hypothetical protein